MQSSFQNCDKTRQAVECIHTEWVWGAAWKPIGSRITLIIVQEAKRGIVPRISHEDIVTDFLTNESKWMKQLDLVKWKCFVPLCPIFAIISHKHGLSGK